MPAYAQGTQRCCKWETALSGYSMDVYSSHLPWQITSRHDVRVDGATDQQLTDMQGHTFEGKSSECVTVARRIGLHQTIIADPQIREQLNGC